MTRRIRGVARVAALASAAVVLAVTPSLVSDASTAGAPPDGARQASRVDSAAVTGTGLRSDSVRVTRPARLDTSNKAAVKRAYRSRLAPNLNTSIGWTGSNRGCRAGKMSARAKAATLESLNFVRDLGGLAPVSWSPMLSGKAQKAALIMSANNSLSHTPPRSWKCWTKAGAKAAGNSNLALAYPSITAGGVIMQYMDDAGSSNIFVGHRRWLMYPPALKFGNGSTKTSNAIWVFGPTASRPNPRFVSWPTAGYFPGPMEPDGRWSLSSGSDSVDFSKAKVHVETAGGAGRRTHVYPVAVGYGKPTLVWEVNNIGSVGTYKVTVRGIKQAGRAHPFAYSYSVRLFSPR